VRRGLTLSRVERPADGHVGQLSGSQIRGVNQPDDPGAARGGSGQVAGLGSADGAPGAIT
jgi:hypothetical protein